MDYLKFGLALVVGIVVGGLVNGALISIQGYVIAPPAGVNPESLESLKQHIGEYKPIQFLFPFLAHALGTLVGAWIVARFAPIYKLLGALLVGLTFLSGGIMMVLELPNSPLWFQVVDLAFAYIPMAYLGYFLAKRSFSNDLDLSTS